MIEVLYEDNHIIAVNKRSSDIVQGDKTGDTPLPDHVKQYLKEKYQKPGNVFLGVVHRLDRPVSGVVLFARTSKALTRLTKMFRDKTIQKTYWAVVEKKPIKSANMLTDWLQKNPKQNKSYVRKAGTGDAKESILNYKSLITKDNETLLEVDPRTGRHHQIRVQLSNMGCIIVGDVKYGAKKSNSDASILLHARKINFTHPVSKEPMEILAPCPQKQQWTKFESII